MLPFVTEDVAVSSRGTSGKLHPLECVSSAPELSDSLVGTFTVLLHFLPSAGLAHAPFDS